MGDQLEAAELLWFRACPHPPLPPVLGEEEGEPRGQRVEEMASGGTCRGHRTTSPPSSRLVSWYSHSQEREGVDMRCWPAPAVRWWLAAAQGQRWFGMSTALLVILLRWYTVDRWGWPR